MDDVFLILLAVAGVTNPALFQIMLIMWAVWVTKK